MPEPYSTNQLPSASSTRAPTAFDDHGGHALGELVGAAREGVRPTGHQLVQALLQSGRALERR